MVVTYNNADGSYTARLGQDFVTSYSSKSACDKLRDTLKKRGPTAVTWMRRRSMRDQSLASNYVRRRVTL